MVGGWVLYTSKPVLVIVELLFGPIQVDIPNPGLRNHCGVVRAAAISVTPDYYCMSSQPTTRSRTLLFISYRDSRARSSRFSTPHPISSYDDPDIPTNENEGLMNLSHPAHVSLDLPPNWVDVSDQVQDILGGTHAKITA